MYELIPIELKNLDRWVNAAEDKTPINPLSYSGADTTNPDTWADFHTVVMNVEKKYFCNYRKNGKLVSAKIAGIGFVFGGADYFGIDVDHCVTYQDGKPVLHSIAQEIITTVQSYTEYSKSGTGIHILCRGDSDTITAMLSNGKRKDLDGITIEMYNSGRYFYCTGNAINDLGIEDCTESAKLIYDKYIYTHKDIQICEYTHTDNYADALNTGLEKDPRFNELWNRTYEPSDESRDDAALMAKLAYWLSNDISSMIEAFKSSPYAAGKDAEHIKKMNRKDYLERTAKNSLVSDTAAQANKEYRERMNSRNRSCEDWDSLFRTEPIVITTPKDITEAQQEEEQQAAIVKELNEPQDDILKSFRETIRTERYKPVPTGIQSIDRMLSPDRRAENGGLTKQELVIIGAAPGMGKTTILQQISESMAAHGETVLFLNLEMSREQLIARSLSRITADTETALSPMQILRGYSLSDYQLKAVDKAINAYESLYEDRMIYNPKALNGTDLQLIINTMTAQAEKAIADHKQAPIVVIDYLQLITSKDKQDDVAVIKESVKRLKDFAIKYNTIVMTVSANNRAANVTGQADMFSGRDTSNIEYSADTFMQMTYTAIENDETYTDGKESKYYTVKKLDKIKADAAENGEPIPEVCNRVTLKVCKARFGINNKCRLTFDGEHARFTDEKTENKYKGVNFK